ncbi:protein TIME FOR COFFEE-like [Iris pallida]|uniref:Protein TIME FOR COFFEE-like n=1 Tax=Iris pallida TaxID=29817 RepID=A0AAX6F2F5_IRIPA|nr:protein TIME FOR COFFEE-like [Iris pallida]
MDRNREARRGSMAAMNGGLSRRRQQRSTNLRDSPEEDGVMEMRESSRLRDRDRDRGIKKDRDRDRSGGSSRSKRRRGERLIHGSNRDEGDDSSEESLDDEDEDDEEDAPVSVRFPPPPQPPTNPIPSSSSSLQQQQQQQQQQQSQNNHVRKSFTSKPARPSAPSWKVAEEMIGVSIPRKARTSSSKRPQECGGGGSGELIHRQASTSPKRRPSPSSNTAVSPSSSNVSVRKKKSISGSKHRPPKSKSTSIQEIEIEVAEVLYGMTRQAPAPPVLSSSRQDTNGLSNEAKSRVSSPGSFSPPPATSQPPVLPTPNLNSSNNSVPLVTIAPKRKRPRLKLEDESPTSPATKPETELPPKLEEGSALVSPLRSEMKMAAVAAAAASPAIENGSTALTDVCTAGGLDHMQESAKPESSGQVPEQKEAKEEIVLATASKSKEAPCSNSNTMLDEATVVKDGSEAMKVDSPREEKFSIDLMAPPPSSLGNSERDGSLDYASDHKSVEPVKEMRLDIAKGEMEKPDRSSKQQEAIEAASAEDIANKHAATEKPTLDLQLDLEKQDKDVLSLGGGGSSSGKHQQQSKPQPKVPRIDPKQEKKAQSAASLPLTMPIAGWPGGFPHFGYMGQVPTHPAVMPMDGSSVASKNLQPPHFFPPQKMKRCATHCYIAKTINYNQQIARMNPFWPPAAAAAAAAAAVGTSPIYGAKQHNLNLMPPSEAAILGNPMQGSFPGRSLGPLQDKASPAVAMTYAVPPAKEKSSAAAAAAAANNPLIEAQRKQFLLQQTPQPVSSAAGPNMLHGPAAFIFPIGQQPAAAPATRSGTAKSTPGIGNAAPSAVSGSSIPASSGPAGHSTTTMSFNYAGLQPNDAQYLAILQNNGYAFPMPAHLGGGPPYRGASPSQAMPFFNGSFYSSPMLHPSSQQQFRQQQQLPPSTHQQPPAHSQQGHQNTSTSSGSSSSQKHHSKQQQRVPGGGAVAGATPAGGNNHNFSAKQHLHLLPPQARQLESEAGCEDSPSTADSSRASQAQKSIYGNFAMSIHPQNFALISPAAAAAAALPSSGSGGGGSHNEKQQPVQNQANLTPSQAYAMSFAPFGGPAAAAAAAGGAQGLDFSSMVQNHALFHSLPEAARHHGYQQITAVAAAAAAAQAAQHKKSHHEDGKSVGAAGAASANVTSEEGKMMASSGKSPGGVAQHSLSFSRPDNDLKTSTILGNSSNIPEGSSRTLNLIQPPANGGRASNRPSSATPATSSPVANAANPTASNLHMQSLQQQQQHLIQLQKSQQQQQQQQQHLQLQQQMQQQMSSRSTKGSTHGTNNATIYSDRMPAGSMSRFSQGALAGFPPSIIQGASAAQSPQWKASVRSSTPGPANPATTSSSPSAKNQLPQQQQQQQQHQQGRNQQQHQQALLSSNVHQTQISFGVSSSKAVGVSGQPHLAGGSSNSSLAAASIAAGSPQSSVSKSSAGNGGGGNGSPRASSSSKSGQPPPTLLSPALPLHQQQAPATKNSPSPSPSNLKSSSPANNRSMTSILGHPQITPATNSSSSTKFQQQSQQQQQQQLQHQQQKQSFHQPQLFFSNPNPYIQAAQSSQSNAAAAAANFYQQQRRHSEQQSQQHSQQQQQQQQQNSTNSGVLSLCPSSLTLAGSSPTSDPAKAARPKPQGDQKASPGSESLHWKPEKR